MLWRVGLTAALSAVSAFAGDVSAPYELIVNRNSDSHQCIHLALRRVQLFRGLKEEGFLKTTPLPTGEERTRYITAHESQAWAYATHLCGDRANWNFQVLTDSSVATLHAGQGATSVPAQVDPPPLDIEPLITSGDSSNRVDLVFFSDGCKGLFFLPYI